MSQMVLAYKYRLLPNKRQHKALAEILESQRLLYNAALEERIGCYRVTGKTRTYMDQCKAVTELRKDKEFSTIPANVQRWTLSRLDDSYKSFFRRLKIKGAKAGFPRFRGKGRWESFGFAEFSGLQLMGRRLYFKGMPGSLRVHFNRQLPEGKILGCVFRRDTKGWSVCFQVRSEFNLLKPTDKSIGVDLGLTNLATLSTGEIIPNARIAKRHERELRLRRRALARCKKGSNSRQKKKSSLSRLYTKISNSRQTYLHQVSTRLISTYDLIAIEDLNVKGMAAGMLANGVHDAAWTKFKQYLTYKAEKAGRQLIEVDPRHTSQACSGCGVIVPKKLSDRWHCCPHCGLSMDRDENAARNVLHRAVVRPRLGNVARRGKRSARNIKLSKEAI